MLSGKDMLLIAELHSASENKRILLPINIQAAKWVCCFEELKTMRDKMGTAIPIKAIGPQKAVVKPVNTDEIRIR